MLKLDLVIINNRNLNLDFTTGKLFSPSIMIIDSYFCQDLCCSARFMFSFILISHIDSFLLYGRCASLANHDGFISRRRCMYNIFLRFRFYSLVIVKLTLLFTAVYLSFFRGFFGDNVVTACGAVNSTTSVFQRKLYITWSKQFFTHRHIILQQESKKCGTKKNCFP